MKQGGGGLGGWQPPKETREKVPALINRISVQAKIAWTAVILRSRDGHDGMHRSITGTGHNCWAYPGAARALERALEPASEPQGRSKWLLGKTCRKNIRARLNSELLLVAGMPAYTIFNLEPFSLLARFLNTQIVKNPRPRKASERHHRICSGAAENPEAPPGSQKILGKSAALHPPNNASPMPRTPFGPRAPEAGAEIQGAVPSLHFGTALWGAKSKI